MLTPDDHRYMARTLQLAARGVGATDPNPTVGCVIVSGDRVVAEGRTAAVGGPHAEVVALRTAGAAAAGATAYVSLEPCAHQGRTGPCATALIEAGIGRVVCAGLDPNPLVSGRGIAMLREAGVAVEQDVLEASAQAINCGYFSRMARGRPWVRVKMAASLDGRTALANGASQWITGEMARRDVHRWRARSSAVVTGVGTVLADDPALTARPDDLDDFVPPVRVVVDSGLRTPTSAQLFDGPGEIVLVHTAAAGQEQRDRLNARGARLEQVEGAPRCDPGAVLRRLAELELNTVWVEAGATLAGTFVESGLADEVIVYLAPDFLGDSSRGMLSITPLERLEQRLGFEIDDVRKFGRDLRITARPSTVTAPRVGSVERT